MPLKQPFNCTQPDLFLFSAPYPTRDNFPCANEQQGIQGATKICQGASGLNTK